MTEPIPIPADATAERDKALTELREAKADAEAAKAERNGMHVRNYKEMQAAIAQRDELAALLREPHLRECTCEEGRDCGCNNYEQRRGAALARIAKPETGKGGAP